MGNGCFNYQTTSVISVNSVHSVQKTQLKCVFCMQVLQQPRKKVWKKGVEFEEGKKDLSLYITPQLSDSSSSLWREWVFQLVGAKGEELLLDK